MEGYRYGKLMEVILAAKKGLSPTRPVHLFGGGHPMVFAFAALAGVDFFDSSSYIKYAKDDRLIFPDSSRRLSEIEELACCCPVCSKHTVPELRKMEKEERTSLLAQHNLGVMFQEIRAVRDAIAGEFLFELVEQRCRSHPSLVEVLNVLEKAQSDMEKAVAVSRRTALFELSEFSMKRPILVRYQQRLRSRWQPFGPFYTLLDDMDSRIRKPYAIGHAGFIHRYLKTHLDDEEASSPVLAMVNSRLGYVPLELSEIYPIAQSVTHSVPFPEGQTPFQEDRKALVEEKGISFVELGEKAPKDLPGKLKRLWEKSYHKSLGIDLRAFQDVFDDFRSLRLKGSTTPFFDIQLLTAVLDYQLGRGAFEAIFLNRPPKDPFPKYGFQRFTTEELEDADISFVKSKNTGKIRNVHGGGEHLLSMHAFDGFFLLKRVAAWRLNQHLSGRHRVKVDPDSAQFNLKGKSVFARFVLEADPDIRPGDEVVVVDPEGKTVAVGSALLTAEEMKAFEVGMAVKVSQGLGKKDKKK